MSVIKKFCEVEEGLLLGRVSIDANTGEITTDGHVNIHSLNLNDNFVVSALGNAVLDGTLLVNSKTTLESLEVIHETTLDEHVHALSTVHIENDLTLSGGDLITTNLNFNLLNTTALTIHFGNAANNINIGNTGDISLVTFRRNVKINNNLEVVNNLNIADGNIVYDTSLGTYGTTTLKGIFNVGQETTLNGDVTINASLSMTGDADITGYIKVLNDFNVNDLFTVDHVTGNTVIHGTQHTMGAVDLDSTLNVDGNTSIGGNTNITGTLDVVAGVDFDSTLNVDGNTTIGGTLGVTGNSTFSGTLAINGTTFTTANDEITISNKINASKVTTSDVVLPNARLTEKTLTLGAWTVEQDPNGDGSLLFKYNGTTVMALLSTGALITANDITSWGTPV
jgi:hypothetical protein